MQDSASLCSSILAVQVRVVDRAVRGGGHDDDLHAGQHGGGRVGAVRGGRDQADVALGVAAGEVVAADRQQARELALGTGVGLDGDLVVAGDLGQLGFEVLDQFAPAGGLGFRGEGVDGGELRPGDGFHLGRGVQLHGARAQRDHGAVQGQVTVREAADVAQQLGLGAVRVEHRVLQVVGGALDGGVQAEAVRCDRAVTDWRRRRRRRRRRWPPSWPHRRRCRRCRRRWRAG